MSQEVDQRRRDRRTMLEERYRRLGIEFVACETCGDPTSTTVTKRCPGCWEVEHRLRDYVRDGGDKARAKLAEALYAGGEVRELTNAERHVWGTCPVCDAKHGEKCQEPTARFCVDGSHVRRLQNAPIRVREVGVP